MGIGYATSNRGACHLRAYTPAAELGVMPFGSLKVDPLEWKGKGDLTRYSRMSMPFPTLRHVQILRFAEGMDEYSASSTVHRPELTADELLQCGERMYNLERYYNNLAGFGEGSDYLPERFLRNPAPCPAPKATSANWT